MWSTLPPASSTAALKKRCSSLCRMQPTTVSIPRAASARAASSGPAGRTSGTGGPDGGLRDQVLEEVAGERELGEDQQVGAALRRRPDQLEVAVDIGPQVAEPGRDLGQCHHDVAALSGIAHRGRLRRRLGAERGRAGSCLGLGHHATDSPPSPAVGPDAADTKSATRAATWETGSRASAAGGSASRNRRAYSRLCSRESAITTAPRSEPDRISRPKPWRSRITASGSTYPPKGSLISRVRARTRGSVG